MFMTSVFYKLCLLSVYFSFLRYLAFSALTRTFKIKNYFEKGKDKALAFFQFFSYFKEKN